ncbi:hypothetical protein [Caldivirga sp.]|uniref:hypothetical protein n=1 Tax=Caldivirga sp. TaxID=2080243 RepID=UPI0025B98907|nr:hypothetical protein [Caldivirga sp.]
MSSKALSLGTLISIIIGLVIGGFLGIMVGGTILAVTTTSSVTTTLTSTSTTTSVTTETVTTFSYLTSTTITTITTTSTVFTYTTGLKGIEAISFNGQNQYFQTPSFQISGGAANLFNYIAISKGSITVVTWVYLNAGDWGPILGFASGQPTSLIPPGSYTPWLYISSNGIVYAADVVPSCILGVCAGGSMYYVDSSTPISTGWHMLTIEEGHSSGNTYYIRLYIDNEFIGASSISGTPQLFDSIQYGYIGVAYAVNTPPSPWPDSWYGWHYFNGYIAEIIIYPFALSQPQVNELFNAGVGNPPVRGYVGLYLVSSYDSVSAVWHDLSGNHYDLTAYYSPSVVTLPTPP